MVPSVAGSGEDPKEDQLVFMANPPAKKLRPALHPEIYILRRRHTGRLKIQVRRGCMDQMTAENPFVTISFAPALEI